jgi:hypothetical protein
LLLSPSKVVARPTAIGSPNEVHLGLFAEQIHFIILVYLSMVHENKGKKIFVHCRLGDDCTGMMVAACRMAEEGWTAEEAMNEMRSFGFTHTHDFISPKLAKYEREFPDRLKNSPALKEERDRHPHQLATPTTKKGGQ